MAQEPCGLKYSPPDISSEGFMTSMMYKAIRAKFPTVKQLSTQQLREWISKPSHGSSLLVLDAREKCEFEISRLSDALHMEPVTTDFGDVINDIADRLRWNEKVQVVVYCSVGYRSSKMAQDLWQALKASPIVNLPRVEVYNLEGSIFKWANENGPLVDSRGQETIFVHEYNSVWGKFLNSDRRKSSL